MFNDDKGLINFLQCVDKYEAQEIDFNDFVKNGYGKETIFWSRGCAIKTKNI